MEGEPLGALRDERAAAGRYLISLIEEEYAKGTVRRAAWEHAHVVDQVHILLCVVPDDIVLPVNEDAHLLHHLELGRVIRGEIDGRRGGEPVRRGPRRDQRAGPATGAR